jgi:formyl-CoA transferase
LDKSSLLGIKVLDLSRVLAGPFCSMLLADMGADVVKLEIPGRGDDSRTFPPFRGEESLYFINLNRGKQGITLNLKHPEGKRIFLELVKWCDVLLENFTPGTMERLGLGYDLLRELNPRLIYASISGFGRTGPYRDRPGYDIIGQAMGGLLSVTGWPDSPPTRVGTAIGDILSALFCCIGILAALKVRDQTSRGQLVDVALVDSVFASLENIPQKYFVEGEVPTRIGNRYEFIYPYDSFRAADGWVIIGIANDIIWQRFIEASGLKALASDERFSTNPSRVRNHEALKAEIEEWTSEHVVVEIVELLNSQSVPASPIYSIKEVVEDPHIAGSREMVVEMEHPRVGLVKLLNSPVKMSETKPEPRGPAPALGEGNEEVLTKILGMREEEIKRLRDQGVL